MQYLIFYFSTSFSFFNIQNINFRSNSFQNDEYRHRNASYYKMVQFGKESVFIEIYY